LTLDEIWESFLLVTFSVTVTLNHSLPLQVGPMVFLFSVWIQNLVSSLSCEAWTSVCEPRETTDSRFPLEVAPRIRQVYSIYCLILLDSLESSAKHVRERMDWSVWLFRVV
jgi:hypothetical protein